MAYFSLISKMKKNIKKALQILKLSLRYYIDILNNLIIITGYFFNLIF